MKKIILLVGVIVIVAGAALGQVDVAQHVATLEAENHGLRATVKIQRQEIDALKKENAALRAGGTMTALKKTPSANDPLEGTDLTAWKMARDAANNLPQSRDGNFTTSSSSSSGGSGGGRFMTHTPGYNTPLPRNVDVGKPIRACMTKTEIGDYIFTFRRNMTSEIGKTDFCPFRVFVTQLGDAATDATQLAVDHMEWFDGQKWIPAKN